MNKKLRTLILLSLLLIPIRVMAFCNGQTRLYCKEKLLAPDQETQCHIVCEVDGTNSVLLVHAEVAKETDGIVFNNENNKIGTIHTGATGFHTNIGNPFNGTIMNAFTAGGGLVANTETSCEDDSRVSTDGCYEFLYPTATFPGGIPSSPKTTESPLNSDNPDFENTVSLGYVTVSIVDDLDDSECADLCFNVFVYEKGSSATSYSRDQVATEVCDELYPAACRITNGKYYDDHGREITEEEYARVCENVRCEEYNGKYYDDEGRVITEEQYAKVCEKVRCGSFKGKYYDQNGNRVANEQAMKNACYPPCGCRDNVCYGPNHETLSKAEMQKTCFSCKYENGKYYGLNGVETNEATYYLQCNDHCKCEGDKCYDDKGKPVSLEEYKKICNPKCVFTGGKYYNDKGEEVSEQQFAKDCDITCRCLNNKCYDKNGNPVSRADYVKICEPKCTFQDGKYYNQKGDEVSKEEYQKDCNPKCECKDGICYDDDGTPITDEEYEKKCNPKCLCSSSKCYNNEGKEITKDEYNLMCACRIENGKYYDMKGKEISSENYTKICGCRKVGGKFFDKDGNEITEEEWNDKCVPKTGMFIPYITVVALGLAIYGTYYAIKVYKKRKKIYQV